MQVTTDKSKYLAFVLSEATKQKLAQAIGEHFPVRVCHHITTLYNIEEEYLEHINEILQNGHPFFKADGFYVTEDYVVISVRLYYTRVTNAGAALGELVNMGYRMDRKRYHITYERKVSIANKDSIKVFDQTTSYRFFPMDMGLDGEFQMLDKEAGTPCIDRTVVVERHPNVIVDKAVYIPCGLFTRGDPDYFMTTDFEGGYKAITATDPEYAKLMEIWNKNKNCAAIAIPVPPKKEKYNFIRNGYQGAGWVAMGESEEGNPKTFILRGNNGDEKVVELLRVGSNQRYWELVDAWKKHIANALSFPFLLHAVQWEVGEFTEEGYPKVFFTNYGGVYSAINFRDGRFNEALKYWCSANNKPVLTMRMVAGEMQFIPAKEETFTFAKASAIGEGWTPCGGFSSEGNPAAFVLRNKNGPSSTVDMNMRPGSTYQRILAAWKARHESDPTDEERWKNYPAMGAASELVAAHLQTRMKSMHELAAEKKEEAPTVSVVPEVKPVFRDENHPNGWVAYQPGGDILGFALYKDGQFIEEVGLQSEDKLKFEKLSKAYADFEEARLNKARRETVIKFPGINGSANYVGDDFNAEGYPLTFNEVVDGKVVRKIFIENNHLIHIYATLIHEWCFRALVTPMYPANVDGKFVLTITPHAAKVQKAQCKHDNWKPSRDCQ